MIKELFDYDFHFQIKESKQNEGLNSHEVMLLNLVQLHKKCIENRIESPKILMLNSKGRIICNTKLRLVCCGSAYVEVEKSDYRIELIKDSSIEKVFYLIVDEKNPNQTIKFGSIIHTTPFLEYTFKDYCTVINKIIESNKLSITVLTLKIELIIHYFNFNKGIWLLKKE